MIGSIDAVHLISQSCRVLGSVMGTCTTGLTGPPPFQSVKKKRSEARSNLYNRECSEGWVEESLRTREVCEGGAKACHCK